MAYCNKVHALKAVLLGGLLLVTYNIITSHSGFQVKDSFSFSHISSEWSKRITDKITGANSTNDDIYSIQYYSDSSNKNDKVVPEAESQNGSKLNIVYNSTYNNDLTSSANDINGSQRNDATHYEVSPKKSKCSDLQTVFDGPISMNTTLESLEVIEKRLAPHLRAGGWHRPKNCTATDHVAIVVPFRDRYAHLPIFLKNLHPFLIKQKIEYGIFIVEQTNGKPFNRAALMNIGFLEALKLFNWDCFIFHDVDLLPLDDRNLYTCPDQPRHMSVAIDIFGYKLPYTSIFGGVSAMTTNQFKAVNGFSNSFWGWGGEDDDMSNRLKHVNFHISRYPINIGRYMMLDHQKEKANPKRYENLANGARKIDIDGLNSIKYEVYSAKKLPLFTWFLVELKMDEHR